MRENQTDQTKSNTRTDPATAATATATATAPPDRRAGGVDGELSQKTADREVGGSNRRLLIQLFALFAVSTLVVYGTTASDKELNKFMPEARTFASINNLKPSGMSAFYELCQRVFKPRPVQEWAMPYRRLQGSKRAGTAGVEKGVLIIVSPDESLAEFEVEDILDWVRQGNALVYLDNFEFRNTKRLLEKIDLGARELDENFTNRLSDPCTGQPIYAHLRVLNLSAQQKLNGGQALVSINGKPVIVQKNFGKGRVLIGSCPKMVANRQITLTERWSNFQFLCNWLATTNGAIFFDEKCHGSTRGLNVIYYFLHGPAGYCALQILLILALAVISCNQRFGAILIVDNRRRISNLEHIEGLSNTYLRAGARQAVISIIWMNVRHKLCKVLQISPREEDEKLNNALAAHHNLRRSTSVRADGRDTRLTGTEAKAIEITGTESATAAQQESGRGLIEMVEKCETAVNRKDLNDEELRDLVAACDKISEQADGLLTTNPSQ